MKPLGKQIRHAVELCCYIRVLYRHGLVVSFRGKTVAHFLGGFKPVFDSAMFKKFRNTCQ